MKIFIITILSIITFTNVHAMRVGGPAPIPWMIEKSDYVITGKVIKTYMKTSNEKYFGDSSAVIVIDNVLKGYHNSDTIIVNYRPYFSCPTPAIYKKDTHVLAFLKCDNDSDLYTYGMSDGLYTMPYERLSWYKKSIQKYVSIASLDDLLEKKNCLLEWAVNSIENRIPVWTDIKKASDSECYYNFYEPEIELYYEELDKDQKIRLLNSLLKYEQNSSIICGLSYKINLLIDDFEGEINDFMIGRLKRMEENQVWQAGYLMKKISELNNKKSLSKIYKKYVKVDRSQDKNRMKKLAKLVKKFCKKL